MRPEFENLNPARLPIPPRAHHDRRRLATRGGILLESARLVNAESRLAS
ncbi:hypothetical protein N8584_02010 [bacterium]|nr:hypothetical protein [bacterium]